MEQEVKGRFLHTIYSNPDNLFCVLSFKSKESDFVAIGNYDTALLKEGILYSLKGEWKRHPKYGKQFSFHTCTPSLSDPDSIYLFLSSGLVKGIGPALARRILDRFGRDAIYILDEEPERLLEVLGIGLAKLEGIKESWKRARTVQRLAAFLSRYEIPLGYVWKIYKAYQENAIEVINKNPYQLIHDIRGIGFKKADNIAKSIGFNPEDPRRIRAGLTFTIQQAIDHGHCFLYRDQLLSQSAQILGLPVEKIEEVLKDIIGSHLIAEEERIYIPIFYKMEKEVAKRIAYMAKCNLTGKILTDEIDHAIPRLEREAGIGLSTEQKNAIFSAFTKGISVITGGPGTGKTQTIKFILKLAKIKGLKVLLAAPTGKAAKRIEETAGEEAKTIHRLLEYDPKTNEFRKNESNPLNADIVILDETSMVDLPLMYYFLKTVPDRCNLILVGDVDQLPSIGPGLVLKDIIDSGLVEVTRLSQIFRQAQGSTIVKNAHRVNQGMYIIPKGADFIFIEEENEEKILEYLKNSIIKLINTHGFDPYHEIQVLSPMKRGILGTNNLNKELQAIINPPSPNKPEILFITRRFRVGDKVMQIRNNYNKGVFNGDVGKIIEIDSEEEIAYVDFGWGPIRYGKEELDELILAYACTVHKYQGSEIKCVIMPLHMSHYIMLQRNLFYTALTRSRELFILFSTKRAIAISVKNNKPTVRNTHLKMRIRSCYQAG